MNAKQNFATTPVCLRIHFNRKLSNVFSDKYQRLKQHKRTSVYNNRPRLILITDNAMDNEQSY